MGCVSVGRRVRLKSSQGIRRDLGKNRLEGQKNRDLMNSRMRQGRLTAARGRKGVVGEGVGRVVAE